MGGAEKIVQAGLAGGADQAPGGELDACGLKHRQKVIERIGADFPMIEQVEIEATNRFRGLAELCGAAEGWQSE